MPQLNLNFTNLPDRLTIVWEQLDSQQKQLIVETLSRLLIKVCQSEKTEGPAHD
jgi:hypothetical protein